MPSQRAVSSADDARSGGILAIVVSALWTGPAAVAIVKGVSVWGIAGAGRGFFEDLAARVGLMMAAIGLGILLTVAVGITLGIRLLRRRSTVGSAVFFGLGAALSGVVALAYLISSHGLVKLWSVPLVINAAACGAVVVLARRVTDEAVDAAGVGGVLEKAGPGSPGGAS